MSRTSPVFCVGQVVSGMSGESEAKVRNLFAAAVAAAPAIIFIDEIDAITPKRETAQREMERRIVAQLLTCMDDLSNPPPDQGAGATNGDGDGGGAKRLSGPVMVIGATNRADSLDPALRRAGRFDREIMLGVPDEAARTRILKVLTAKLRLEGAFDFAAIGAQSHGGGRRLPRTPCRFDLKPPRTIFGGGGADKEGRVQTCASPPVSGGVPSLHRS